MVNRHVSGAHYGLRDWLAQRITAVVMILYTVLFVVMLLKMPQFDYAGWRSVWMAPLMRYATLLFLLCLFVHAWVGMRNIFMDYIKPTGVRLLLEVLTIVALAGYAIWAANILWSI